MTEHAPHRPPSADSCKFYYPPTTGRPPAHTRTSRDRPFFRASSRTPSSTPFFPPVHRWRFNQCLVVGVRVLQPSSTVRRAFVRDNDRFSVSRKCMENHFVLFFFFYLSFSRNLRCRRRSRPASSPSFMEKDDRWIRAIWQDVRRARVVCVSNSARTKWNSGTGARRSTNYWTRTNTCCAAKSSCCCWVLARAVNRRFSNKCASYTTYISNLNSSSNINTSFIKTC